MITIRDYAESDRTCLVALIEQLQDYLIEIDPLKRLRRLPSYGHAYTEDLLAKINKNNGKIYVATSHGSVIGIVAGTIEEQTSLDQMECVPSKTGKVLELIVDSSSRGSGAGSALMTHIETYFKQQGCTILRVEVFWPNTSAQTFYEKKGYSTRVVDMVKLLS